MVSWGNVQWGSVAQWLSAIRTLNAVMVALFKEGILSRLYRPKLTVRARQSPPDIDHILFRYPMPGAVPPGYKPIHLSADCYFLRLWIQNDGNVRAEKVQVFVSELHRETANGTFVKMESFIPMNLRWSF